MIGCRQVTEIRDVTAHAAQGGRGHQRVPGAARVRAIRRAAQVGFLTVRTGPLAAGGKQQEEGAALFLKERGGAIAGRKIELITEDTAGSPALAKTKTQELVERHKVAVMIGPLATNEALAMDGYVHDAKVPLITTTSAATVDLKKPRAKSRESYMPSARRRR